MKTGEVSEGTLEAVDRFSVARDLRSRGHVPLSIREQGNSFLNKFSRLSSLFSQVSVAEQIILTKNLSGMLQAGLPISRALSVLQKQTKNPKLDAVLVSLTNDITSGGTLSEGLAKFPDIFSTLFVSMAKTGEESGNLSGALSEIGISLEKSHALTKKIKGALIYPGIIFSAMIVLGVLMFAFVVPTLAGTFKELGVVLPLSTRVLVFLGNFFSNNLLLTFLFLILIFAGIYSLFRAKFAEKYIDQKLDAVIGIEA
ncbi:MAG: type II secretion system F family protein, partial [Patescibacteria group bacterium]